MSHYWIEWMTPFGQGIDDDFPWEKWVDRFVCGFVYIWKTWVDFEIMLNSLIEYGKCTGNGLLFNIFNICNSWRNNRKWHQAVLRNCDTLQYLNPLFTESNATTWAILHTRAAKENDTAIRHFGGGQLLHLFCGCKLWFGEMHHFGSSECFSNVLIKVSPCCTPSLLSSPHFQE